MTLNQSAASGQTPTATRPKPDSMREPICATPPPAATVSAKGSGSSISQNSTLPGGRTERTGSGRRARESQPPCTGDEFPMQVVSVQLGEAPGHLLGLCASRKRAGRKDSTATRLRGHSWM